MDAMSDPLNEDPGGGGVLDMAEHPKIKDTAELGGGIWIILFGMVIVISLVANLLLSILVVRNRKKHNLVYLMHLLIFAINVVDFSLLIFEFNLGIEHQYPYSQTSCTMYQAIVKGNPIIQASAIVVMLLYTAKVYSTQNLEQQTSGIVVSPDGDRKSLSMFLHNSFRNGNNSVTTVELERQHRTRSFYRRNHDIIKFVGIVVFLVCIELILSVPTALFASIIVDVQDKRYCEIDLSSSSFLSNDNDDTSEDATSHGYFYSVHLHQLILCLYYLIYSSILTFWLPLMISIYPAIRLVRDKHRDKYPEVSVVLATVSSFFVFYVFHAILVFGRHFYDLLGQDMSTYNLWMIKVCQSLLLLIAYFWNFIRPALALSLDPDLKLDMLKMFNLSEYGALPGPPNNPQSHGNRTQYQQQSRTLVPFGNEVERQTEKWELVTGVKSVFTGCLFGKKNSNQKEERRSFLIIPLSEVEMSTENRQDKDSLTPTLQSTANVDNSIDDEKFSALTQTSEQIGENNC